MKVGDLIDYLYTFGNDEEIEIEIHETATGRFVDSTAAVAISDSEFAIGPTLLIDVEAGKFKKFL